MTLEEGLVVLLAAVAAILLFLGLAQALDARPAGSAARPRRQSSGRRTRTGEPAPPARPIPSDVSPGAADMSSERPPTRSPGSRLDSAPAIPPTATDSELDSIERALALHQEGQHAQVIEVAEPHLKAGGRPEGGDLSFVQAVLWTLVGVSRHVLGDIEGAKGALDVAVRAAPDGISEGCPQRIAAAAAPSARQLLAAADAMSATSGERVAVLRMTVLWLEWCIVAAQASEEVSVLLDRAREALWDGYVEAGWGLMRRRQFVQAQSLARQALDSEDLPATRRAPLVELAALSVVRQIGRLVATARGTETPKADALDALDRAREILAASSVEAITPGRWHAANRRIWRGYTLMGQREIAGFDLEAALRPIFSALRLHDLDLGLARRSRVLLVRTIERILDGAGETIGRLLQEGERSAARQRWQEVRGITQKARDQGLSHDELAHAFGQTRQLLEQIEAAER